MKNLFLGNFRNTFFCLGLITWKVVTTLRIHPSPRTVDSNSRPHHRSRPPRFSFVPLFSFPPAPTFRAVPRRRLFRLDSSVISLSITKLLEPYCSFAAVQLLSRVEGARVRPVARVVDRFVVVDRLGAEVAEVSGKLLLGVLGVVLVQAPDTLSAVLCTVFVEPPTQEHTKQ